MSAQFQPLYDRVDPSIRHTMMTSKIPRPSFEAAYDGFKRGAIDDTAVNTLRFGRRSTSSSEKVTATKESSGVVVRRTPQPALVLPSAPEAPAPFNGAAVKPAQRPTCRKYPAGFGPPNRLHL
ncbi:MAG: hypothetical protein AVDCRST_MAG77-2286 [uncultured Chloroflexi bacterium]|uniref:Uncharacterized protein n=1 Tax=uncultured Chloroflexota bacterium TaxID=166587 RepID=A0A6J4IKJ8_9CHLR|nr:MAG: hypothetical protein AVDCRST_MAG77-2286 [uncultured Chloroflexota bacterium]